MEYLLQHDTNLWVALSFILFAAVAYKLGRKSVTGALDSRIAEIKKEIETAEGLRIEAQELLAQYQRKQRDSEREAMDILESAQAHADRIQKQAETDFAAQMQRREAQLEDRLKRIEQSAIAEIQNHAAELAVSATREIILRTLDERAGTSLSDQSIKTVSKYLNG